MTAENANEVVRAASDIVKFVAAFYNVPQSAIIRRWTKSRQNLAHAKIAATCLLKEAFPALPYQDLSAAFGGKHHSLAMTRINTARKLYARDMVFRTCMDEAAQRFCCALKVILSPK